MTDNETIEHSKEYEKILSGLDPKTAARFKDASKYTIERIPTASLGMNKALLGGIPKGRLTFLWGNKSAGKSTQTLEMIREVQQAGGIAAFIDAERTFDTAWAERFGVDTKNLLFSQSQSITAVTTDIIELQQAKVDLIVADSITAMAPSSWQDDKGNFKDVEDSKQIGQQAREFSIAVPMWIGTNDNTALVAISQARNKFGQQHASFIPSGGEAMQFYSSVIIKLWSSGAESQAIAGKVTEGDFIFDETIGRKVNWLIEKNKTGPQFRSGEYTFYFDGDNVGIDRVAEVLDYSVRYGLIQKGGAGWYTIEGQKFQGQKAVDFLADNPELLTAYEKRIVYGG
jgi:recombination protein RecA